MDDLDIELRIGPGIGLSSVRERLELDGGSLTVWSAPGAGTRVTIEIPVSPGTADGDR